MEQPNGRDFLNSVQVTPLGFFACLAASIPALLIAKLFVAVATPVAKDLIKDARFEGNFLMPFCYFVIYGLGGYFFVWVGASLTMAFRPFDTLFYFVLATICGLALIPDITPFGALGTAWGALVAVYLFGKSFLKRGQV